MFGVQLKKMCFSYYTRQKQCVDRKTLLSKTKHKPITSYCILLVSIYLHILHTNEFKFQK